MIGRMLYLAALGFAVGFAVQFLLGYVPVPGSLRHGVAGLAWPWVGVILGLLWALVPQRGKA